MSLWMFPACTITLVVSPPSIPASCQGGRDQLLVHALEVDALLVIKPADHKCSHCPTPLINAIILHRKRS